MVVHRYKLVRGALDFGGVVNRATARSRYGGPSSHPMAKELLLTSNSQEAKIIDPFVTPVFEGQFCIQSSSIISSREHLIHGWR